MTNEDKLKKLLEVAQNNGWKQDWYMDYPIYVVDTKTCQVSFVLEKHEFVELSLNDLVTNWEVGEVSFLQALGSVRHLKSYKQIDENDEYWLDNVEETRVQWTLQPTSERLDWLFDTFNHLLDEK